MSSINTVSISGNLTRDAELNATTAGKPVLNFFVAVNEGHKNKETGEWESTAAFVKCVLFGNYAETIAPSMKKGTPVAVSGKLHYNTWVEKTSGTRRNSLEVYVNDIMLPRRDSDSSASTGEVDTAQGAYAMVVPSSFLESEGGLS